VRPIQGIAANGRLTVNHEPKRKTKTTTLRYHAGICLKALMKTTETLREAGLWTVTEILGLMNKNNLYH
jgi:hypothetical protein